MTNLQLYSQIIEYLAKNHAYRFSKSNFAICCCSEHLLGCHGDDTMQTLLDTGTRAQWVNAMIQADQWWKVESAKAIEAHKQKSASWQVAK